MALALPTVEVSNDPERQLRYRCHARGCNYSSSHCEGYGGFVRVGGHMLCEDCAASYQRLQEGFLNR